MLLSFTMTLILWGLWQGIETRPRHVLRPYIIAGLGMGLALLAKGPVGVALPLLIAILYLFLARRWGTLWKNWSWPGAAIAVLIAIIIGVPWYLAVAQRKPDFLENFLFRENLGRFSGKEDYHDKTSPFFYVPVLLLGLWPWTPFLMQAIARLWTKSRATAAPGSVDEAQQRARLFLWMWAGFIVVFFSISGTKLITYVLPAFPALAMLVGEAMGGLSKAQPSPAPPEGSTLADEVRPGWWTATPIAVLVLNAVLLVASVIFLLNDKTLPRTVAMPFVIAFFVVLVAGSIALICFWRARQVWRLVCAQAATAAALYLILLSLAGRTAPYEDISPMMQALRPYLRPGDRVIENRTFQPTAIFYLARPIMVINYPNTSGLDEAELRSSMLYWPDAKALRNFLADKRRAFVLTRSRNVPSLPARVYPVAYNNDYTLVSNQPAPPGFHYDFRAPRQRSNDAK